MTNLSTCITNSSVEGEWLFASGNSFQYIQQVNGVVLSLAHNTRRHGKGESIDSSGNCFTENIAPLLKSQFTTEKTFKGFQDRGFKYVLRSVCCSLALRSRSHMGNGSATRNF